jgi:hypothetical protein
MIMSDLPQRLTERDHEIVFQPRRDDALRELREEVERQYVHIQFIETRGGTELGFPLDAERSQVADADWETGKGEIHAEGNLRLDGVPVRCVVDLDLATLSGHGRLELLEPQGTTA